MSNEETKKRTVSLNDLIELEQDDREEPLLPLSIENNKWMMPRLNINDDSFYIKSQTLRHFTDEVATETCLSNCCGIKGLKAACCQINPETLEHVLGPIDEDWIVGLIKVLKSTNGMVLNRNDIVIDFEEGRAMGRELFNDHPVFQDPKAYPILRMQVMGPRFACKFLNPVNGKCNIYKFRPEMCRGYYCAYVKANFVVKKPGTGNTFMRIKPKEK
jgi:Fe-S-cluster containining protein